MGHNAGILLSHNPSAEPGHSFTSVSLLPRQHLGWVWWWMHAHTCILLYNSMYLCTHKLKLSNLFNTKNFSTYVNIVLRWERRIYAAAETLTALSAWGRYTKCSLPLVLSPAPKPIFCSLLLFTIHALLFWKAFRKACPPPASILLIQTRRKQKHRDQTSTAGYQTSSLFWRIDYRCQHTQSQLCKNKFGAREDLILYSPPNYKKCKWMKF